MSFAMLIRLLSDSTLVTWEGERDWKLTQMPVADDLINVATHSSTFAWETPWMEEPG